MNDHLRVANEVLSIVCMSKTKLERQEIALRLPELDGEDWIDDEEWLTIHEKALLEARLAAYAKNPDAGSTWEEVQGRILSRLSNQPNG